MIDKKLCWKVKHLSGKCIGKTVYFENHENAVNEAYFLESCGICAAIYKPLFGDC